MKSVVFTVAMLTAAPFAYSAPVVAAEGMMAAACQPLTRSNMEACCSDNEWRNIILPNDVRFCPPMNANDKDSGRIGESLVDNENSGEVPGGDDTTGSIAGNPGNAMGVGGAGEKDKDNESPTTGTQGDSK